MTYEWHTSTYEWHTDHIRVRPNDIRITYEYIRVTYEWHTDGIQVHTSTYEWHTDDIRVHASGIRMTYEYILMTYEWHTNHIRVTYGWHAVRKKNKEFPACDACFGLFTKIKKGSRISFWCTFSAWFFHANAPYLILYQLTKFQCHIFFPSQDIKQNLLLSSYLDIWWCHKLKRFTFNHPLKQWPNGE